MVNRLDVYLVENALATGRDAAKRLIAEGGVYVNGVPAVKAGQNIDGAEVELRGETLKYVSRGGLKLEKAVAAFGLDLRDKIAADIGASSGGFTDCMLQNGAARVYAVDVGHGQLSPKLVADSRVINIEGTDARNVRLPEKVDFVSIDVAFISLKLVLPAAKLLLKDDGELVALIKPQFEAGRENLNKKGVVRDAAVRRRVVEDITEFAAAQGFFVKDVEASPILGPEGNAEFLLYALRGQRAGLALDIGRKINTLFTKIPPNM